MGDNILSGEKVLIPAAYAESQYCKTYKDAYKWASNTISRILSKQEYMGHTVLGKTVIDNYKTKKRREARPDELMIFKNTHEAIIDEKKHPHRGDREL